MSSFILVVGLLYQIIAELESISRYTLARQCSRESPEQRLLTSRELEVLHWLARGKSNSQIGAILEISAATVSKHLKHIYPKLGVENRTAAASYADHFGRDDK